MFVATWLPRERLYVIGVAAADIDVELGWTWLVTGR
jgi:hypothetical protein